jgi:hypothetical protein
MSNLKDRIAGRIRGSSRCKVFVNKDFLDMGSRAAVDQALSRMVKYGMIRRIGRGLFDYPRSNATLGIVLSPDIDDVAQAVARKRGSVVQPSGAFVANAIGVSTQVPGKNVYLTDASSGTIQVGKQTVTIKHVAPKGIGTGNKTVSPMLRALYFLGKDGITDEVVSRLRAALPEKDKKKLLRQSRYTVGWLSDAVQRIIRRDVEGELHG